METQIVVNNRKQIVVELWEPRVEINRNINRAKVKKINMETIKRLKRQDLRKIQCQGMTGLSKKNEIIQKQKLKGGERGEKW